MRYLIFDIECCDGKHICEFGYIIADENFNVITKDNMLINPKHEFNLTGREHHKDLILSYTEEQYNKSPEFPTYYEKIKSLLSEENQIIIGHSILNDAYFLDVAYRSYKLKPVEFSFIDSQLLYKKYCGDDINIALEDACEKLNLPKPDRLHKSDDDALSTMNLTKALCEKFNTNLSELVLKMPEVCGNNKNISMQYYGNDLGTMLKQYSLNPKALSKSKQEKCLRMVVNKIELSRYPKKSLLNGKKICFSRDFEREHFKDCIVLIKMLSDYGCKYNFKVSDNDYYVGTEEELNNKDVDKHSRLYAARLNDDDRNVKIIRFDEMCNLLNTNMDEITKMPMPYKKFLNSKKPKNNKNTKNNKYNCSVTISELINSK